MAAKDIVPRPASTLILTRDSPAGLEVFMTQRTHEAVFMPGFYVFPGGVVDQADGSEELLSYCYGVDEAKANRLLGLEQGGLAYLVAAVRECFEEAGLLLACDRRGRPVRIAGPEDAKVLAALRRRMWAGEITLLDLCRELDVLLDLQRLAFFSHWVTPVGPPRRYDTRFFVAAAPPEQTASCDGEETIAAVWIRPGEALERGRRGQFPLASPTIRTLKALSAFPDTAALLSHARQQRAVEVRRPRFAMGRAGVRLFHEGDPPYAEICKVDPHGTGRASYEILPGVITRLAPTVRRITAPNPSVMTGPGTNTYLIGRDEIAVIDPGPAIEEHVERIVAAGEGRIRWILTTHTHPDHSPAARLLKESTGAEVLGMPAPEGDAVQDREFRPDRIPVHGERLRIDGQTLRVIHTPGHASNHLCFLLEEEGILFSGDHIMQGSTVVINPPDGDMGAYLRSLHALHEEEFSYIAPAHGFLMDRPYQVIDRLISHRLARESKVIAALRQLGPADEDALVKLAYDDVPEVMHPLAKRSLLAHLLKLQEDGEAARDGKRWRLLPSAVA